MMFGFIGISHWEILLVLGIFLLLFGNRIPGIARSLGTSITEFKKGAKGIEGEAEGNKEESQQKSKDN